MEALAIVLKALEVLRTPAILLFVAIGVIVLMKLRAQAKLIAELKGHKADLVQLNGLGKRVATLEKEFGHEMSKTRIAVAALAQKVGAPEVLRDFLK